MKKNKGFTLIELLAVIVILAVIALIAVPLILNIINKSRKGAFERSADSVLKASKSYYALQQLEPEGMNAISFYCDGENCQSSSTDKNGNPIILPVEGNVGTGNVNIDKEGNVSFQLSNGSYCAFKIATSNEITVSSGDCSGAIDPNDTTAPVITASGSPVRRNNEIIVGYTIEEEGTITRIDCKYGEQGQSLNKVGIATETGCRLTDIENDKTYAYEIVVYDLGGNHSEALSDNTGSVEAGPTAVVEWTHYNGKDEVITHPKYSNHDVATVTFSNANYYYVLVTTTVNSSVNGVTCNYVDLDENNLQFPGIPDVDACTGATVTEFAPKTWYKVSGNAELAFNSHGKVYAYTTDDKENTGTGSGESNRMSLGAEEVKYDNALTGIECPGETETTVKCALDTLYDTLS